MGYFIVALILANSILEGFQDRNRRLAHEAHQAHLKRVRKVGAERAAKEKAEADRVYCRRFWSAVAVVAAVAWAASHLGLI